MSQTEETVLTVSNLTKHYACGHKAVDNVSFSIRKGECLGLAGESGSGKSTLARCLLLLEKIDQGDIWLHQQPLGRINKKEARPFRRKLQAVFQNPAASLNPKLKIIDAVMEPLDVSKNDAPLFLQDVCTNRRLAAERLFAMVGLQLHLLDRYPHELSGGQQQRVLIARAISTEPSFIIFDEPTASLDVTSQANILDLLKDLQEEMGLSYLFISHDLAAVHFMSHRIMIMKDGQIADHFEKEELFSEKRHPYSKKLLQVFES
ncbi:dipeptide/oligopeptide/nickel ABC transporter ATP-binding protein [Bacillus sonorensis]|uniref:ABC transporter ATP-binding protein n=1 Tax=Bacillus sonorensis TaxID=119858 RepID=UPI0004970778|nr:dipeptide/oligopeptide/nickel ABC transporter ATP-binding protein [Bacillus sonorensis]MCF7617943.1 dipeptide/oligopeptide/nickel ABC transporter ATP-binding protein [Bacillus sonorensis]MCY8024222.1 dipeptide/oligopeptide/nickel ABC transporter ATP-binding protein [Bacillus sonorensis]MCY8036182.1 dipeptide/oligopeptide/nickel ABC transporter ATP-binding protein [Bacillus sonorensis]MCY8089739.1 dipeptide/oligopeptide/nickel ABC transporter ATP-binding protein [Bacillus sonorensis]MCY84050